MENSKFVAAGDDEKEFGIGVDKNVPYIAVSLTREQFAEIAHRRMDVYDIEGKRFFDERDKEGKNTGRVIFFLIFQ